MTELDIYKTPRAEVAVTSDIDSWAQIAGSVIKLANEIYDTPFVPDGLRGSAPAVAAAILAGREMGIGPMTALQQIHIIKNKPAQSALLMRALILKQGHQWQDVVVSDTRVVVKAKRRGESDWTEAEFTAVQAKAAGISFNGYPQDKLYARATSRLARRKFADVIAGMPYSAEELEDEPGGEALAIEAPKPTGRVTAAEITGRQAATQTASPAEPQPRAADASTPPVPSAGEAPAPDDEPDDTDYGTPGTVTPPQLKKLGAIFTGLGFTSKEREQRLVAASQIIGRDIESSSDLSRDEARKLIDTLDGLGGSREKLIALLASGTEAGE